MMNSNTANKAFEQQASNQLDIGQRNTSQADTCKQALSHQ